jgi:hypothetical protein
MPGQVLATFSTTQDKRFYSFRFSHGALPMLRYAISHPHVNARMFQASADVGQRFIKSPIPPLACR